MSNNIPNNSNTVNENITIINNKVNTNEGKVLSGNEKSEIINLVKKLEDESVSYYDTTLIDNCNNIITDTNNINTSIKNKLDESLVWNNYNNNTSKLRENFLNVNNLINKLGNGLEEKQNQIKEQIEKCSNIKQIYKDEKMKLQEKIKQNNKLALSSKQFYNNQINIIRELDNKINRNVEIYDQYLLKINSLIDSCTRNKSVYSTRFKTTLYNTFLKHYENKINSNYTKIDEIKINNNNKTILQKLIDNRKIVNDISKIFDKVISIINSNPLKLKAINKFNPEIEKLKEKIQKFNLDLESSIKLFKNKVTGNITTLSNNIQDKTIKLKEEVKRCIGKLINSNIPGLEAEYIKLSGLVDQLKINNDNKNFKDIKNSLIKVSAMSMNGNLGEVKTKLKEIISKLGLNNKSDGNNKILNRTVIGNIPTGIATEIREENINSSKNSNITTDNAIKWKSSKGRTMTGKIISQNKDFYKVYNVRNSGTYKRPIINRSKETLVNKEKATKISLSNTLNINTYK
jgi:filamentous hemagglutinin